MPARADKILVDVGHAVILVGLERRAANAVRGGQAGLGLDGADDDLIVGLSQELGRDTRRRRHRRRRFG